MEDNLHHKSDEPSELSYQLLRNMTDDFNDNRIVGSGTFGTVYKAIGTNGEEIAVKVPRAASASFDTKEFHKEFENLRRLKHQNVVQLLGFCDEKEEVLMEHEGKQIIADVIHTALCFEYVPNGSLSQYIADESAGLNWHIRYNIIKGMCEGLKYLREGLDVSIWHLDLKPGNILIDNNMVPKIADFGLSRLYGEENTRKTSSPVGTCGYLPPEYIKHQIISKEYDIFSLGVIIAKLMTGREGYSTIADMTRKKSIKHVYDNWRKRLREIMEPRPLEVYSEQVRTCIEIALECTSEDRHKRPTIQCIVSKLIETETLIGYAALPIEQLIEKKTLIGYPALPLEQFDGKDILERPSLQTATDDGRGKTQESKPANMTKTFVGELRFDFLREITNNFSSERILSEGAYGTVYKGILQDGEVIAVKKLATNAPVPHEKVFANEIQNIMALKHENIQLLFGYCHEQKKEVVQRNGRYIAADIVESLLCYEYLPHGNLQQNLFETSVSMPWDIRFRIIKGICNGLLFLHQISIIHMDLKPENILLDYKMSPKIADFGLSRIFGEEQTRMNTKHIVGSHGYLAPEYLYRGEISTKSDMYSLGLVIIETTTGERNSREDNEPCSREFIDSVRERWTLEHIVCVYSRLDSDQLYQVKACIDIGLQCVETQRKKRPTIHEVTQILKGLRSYSNRRSDSHRLVDLHPLQLRFPCEPKRLTSCSLYLRNNTDDHIAFKLATKMPRRYLTKLPLCGIVPPKCSYSLSVIMREQKQPPSNSDNFLTLQSIIAREDDIDNLDPPSVAEFLFLEGASADVEEAVIYEPRDDTLSNQIIDNQNYQKVSSIDVHPTEPWILTTNQRGYVCIWNYQTEAEVGFLKVTRGPVYSAKFIEREEWLVVGGGDGYIYVYNYGTMEEVDIIEAHRRHHIMSLAVNQTHSLALSASDDNTIKLWDWKRGWECIRTYEAHDDIITQVMFDPRNSESFASASLDHSVKIWNISSATCNLTWDGHLDGLHCLQYHPRNFEQFLISGSSDGAAKVWDLQTESSVGALQGHSKSLSALCWHSELRVLVTGSLDGTVQIWKSTRTTYRQPRFMTSGSKQPRRLSSKLAVTQHHKDFLFISF